MSYLQNKFTVFISILIGLTLSTSIFAQSNVSDGEVYQIVTNIVKMKKKKLARIEVRPVGDLHCNDEYPWKLIVSPSEGVELEDLVLKKSNAKHFSDSLVVFDVPLKLKSNIQKVEFVLKLSMCNDKQCFMKKVPVAVSIK